MAWVLPVLLGTVLCVGLDLLHVQSGTTFYTRPLALGVAGWTPFLFAAASFAALFGTRSVRGILGVPPVPTTSRRLLADGAMFVLAYGSTSFLGAAPVALAVLLAGVWVARVLVDTPRWVVLTSLLTAVLGSGVEVLLSAAGLFGYHHPDLLGIPWWLPAIYLHAAVLASGLEARIGSPS